MAEEWCQQTSAPSAPRGLSSNRVCAGTCRGSGAEISAPPSPGELRPCRPNKRRSAPIMLIKTFALVAAGAILAASAFAQNAGQAGGSPLVPVQNEPAPKLIVEPPLPGPLARGAVLIPYRVENLR